MDFSNSLLHWYLQNKRDLPWRNTTNPYPIWLSEIMLQQTRVAQGMPYFHAFMEAFPTVFDLAKADEEQVLKLWQGLGYYSRARNMHKTAQIIAFELGGNFPNNYSDLLKLKGVGEYTAAAIASFAFNEVVPVVDGNVFRVLSRYFNVETDIASATAKKEFSTLAKELIPKNNPALFNQAIMEFGALQCVPKNPNCEICIFNSSCAALQKKKVNELPVKLKKTKVTNRFFNYLIFLDNYNNTIIKKRIEKGIWHNLYEFPVIESDEELDFDLIVSKIEEKYSNLSIESVSKYNEVQIIHKLSHQKLHINFYKVDVILEITGETQLDALKNYPFPVVIYNFIEKYSI
ncbi:A/G-specific adenine glycosylase [Flavobacterium aquatile]|uniref:Adenine DNA glycosylase n=1 Tax=Flavobacterium aquatile LMG 4008 = ATCC 11947 TaxID=1453498 RepID=A0A095UXB6_9FLAO|nr:A/G-specific adenine glycosylase [Flavobacterium aquatile]KGD67200.1 adenine glycosylase [Flavobacterium aquatile LMG 4008 = ATCC 11947]OXA66647.1 A/G-specific adenine glycosylase [Flavobacterium aquatile LMG 4008 = ATCC 11947]GEC78495.1 A/G-specific adenine glycosylase [Flavobacterium aquatile]